MKIRSLVSKFESLLWWASGATRSVLVSCPTEHKKYAAIGASILGTAILAATGVAFALEQTFGSVLVSIAGGVTWGAMILTFERLIQITIRKEEGKGASSFAMAMPRIGMIVLLSFLISDPLLHKFFEQDIDLELAREAQRTAGTARAVSDAQYGEELARLNGLHERLVGELTQIRDERDRRFDEWMGEGAGTGGTRVRGKGMFYLEKEAVFKKADAEYVEAKLKLEPEVARVAASVEDLVARKDADVSRIAEAGTNAKGFLARNSALFAIIRRDFGAGLFAIALMLAMILLESTPLTLKLMSKRGPYDERLDALERAQMYLDKRAAYERMHEIQLESELREGRAERLASLTQESLRKIAEAIANDNLVSLGEEDEELAGEIGTHVRQKIRSGLEGTHDGGQPEFRESDPTGKAFLVIDMSDPEERSFQLAFNCPADSLKGSDLYFALAGIDTSLLPPDQDRPPLDRYRAVTEEGVEIEPDKPLFAQLGGNSRVRLVLDVHDGSNVTN